MTDEEHIEALARTIYDLLECPVQDALRQQRQWMLALDIAAAVDTTKQHINDNNATRLLRQCYATLAFAFARIHTSARTRDTELCLDFQRVRAQIEDYFRVLGVKL